MDTHKVISVCVVYGSGKIHTLVMSQSCCVALSLSRHTDRQIYDERRKYPATDRPSDRQSAPTKHVSQQVRTSTNGADRKRGIHAHVRVGWHGMAWRDWKNEGVEASVQHQTASNDRPTDRQQTGNVRKHRGQQAELSPPPRQSVSQTARSDRISNKSKPCP